MTIAAKAPVVGVPISMTSYDGVLEAIDKRPADKPLVVAVCNVHSVMSARRDPALATALRSADIATPDGMPLVWTLRRTANPDQERVYGPDLMRAGLTDERSMHWKHYLYGSTPKTLAKLKASIADLAPEATVVGAYSPPFRTLSSDEESEDVERIKASGADIVWIGLGMPKQELWMHRLAGELPGVALVGVGAAFDFLAGTVEQAPDWMKRAGLEWLFRLSQEPRRLWRRYVWNNPAFVVLVANQLIRRRIGKRPRSADRYEG